MTVAAPTVVTALCFGAQGRCARGAVARCLTLRWAKEAPGGALGTSVEPDSVAQVKPRDWSLLAWLAPIGLLAQVDQGDVEIVNIRESDGRLGPLVFTLVAMGVITLFATVLFWWSTRPNRTQLEGE